MAWGGGGGSYGGGGFGGGGYGGMRGGPGGHPGSPQAGLPFAGIPSELQEGVDKILETEPEHPDVDVEFTHRSADTRRFTLRRFVAPHKFAILMGALLVGVEIGAEQIGPLLFGRAIDSGIRDQNLRVIVVLGIAYLGSILLNMVARGIRTAFTGRLGERLLYSLRIRIFSHLQRLSLDFYTEEKAGRVMTRMTSDIEALQQLFHDGLINLLVQGITLAFVVTVLFILNVRLAIVVCIGILPLMLAMTVWFRRASDKAFLAVRERIADVLADLAESLSGIRIVAMYNRQRHNAIKHRNIVGNHLNANLTAARITGIYGPGIESIGVVGQLLILVVGGGMVLRGTLTLGEMTSFILYLSAFFAPIQQLVQLYNTYQQGRAAVSKLRDLLARQPSVMEAEDAYELPAINGEVVLDRVNFSYLDSTEGGSGGVAAPRATDSERQGLRSPRDNQVLSDVSLHIRTGETFALVGPTGAGKSTIAKLLDRFYDPQSGTVEIDGHDIKKVTLDSLRRQLGVVPQEPFLFAGSIRDNIAFARPDATDEEILQACTAVGIDDLIDRLPMGLDTPCHERGITLSSGERQLIALARAFVAGPRVIILDEATSNLDLGTEAKIERALDVLLEGRTAILIAHRLSTAMRADRIAVIDGGRVVEIGTHDDLVTNEGRYADMFETWMRHSVEDRVSTDSIGE